VIYMCVCVNVSSVDRCVDAGESDEAVEARRRDGMVGMYSKNNNEVARPLAVFCRMARHTATSDR
jgi:hypothetical protein